MAISVGFRPATDPDLVALVASSVTEIFDRYPVKPVAPPLRPDIRYLVLEVDGAAVACGGIQPLEPGTVEIKRMYVRPALRRRGLARRVLAELEAAAGGASVVRLRTGNRQPEAVALYESAGYRRIPLFGPYEGDPVSLCYEKVLR